MNPAGAIRQVFALTRPHHSELMLLAAPDERWLRATVEALVGLQIGPVEASADARTLRDAPAGGVALLALCGRDVAWLNQHRPLIKDRRLKLVIWARPSLADRLARNAADLFDWLSQRVDLDGIEPAGHDDDTFTRRFWRAFPAGLVANQIHRRQYTDAVARQVRGHPPIPAGWSEADVERVVGRALHAGLGRVEMREQLFAGMPPLLAANRIERALEAALRLDVGVLAAVDDEFEVGRPLAELWLSNAVKLEPELLGVATSVESAGGGGERVLAPDELDRLAEALRAAIRTEADAARVLLSPVRRMRLALPWVGDPLAQLRSDLNHLNRAPPDPDGRHPFAVWLKAVSAAVPSAVGESIDVWRRQVERRLDVGDDALPREAQARLDMSRARGAPPEVVAALERRVLELKRGRLHFRSPGPGLRLSDRWDLIERLGRGGFAEVWKAWDEHLRVHVAVKILHAQFAGSAERRARFFRGARQMARLAHPHIVRIVEPHAVSDGFQLFVMELLAGGDLERAIVGGHLERAPALRAVVAIADAADCAHAQGLVHRDIKPSNILLTGDGVAKLTDFDLVLAGDTTAGTRTGALGTFLYAAPEALEDAGRVTPAADVYSLGMTAAFGLLGRRLGQAMLRVPERVLAEVQGFSATTAEILRAIDWEPDARHPTASAFGEALRAALARDTGRAPGERPSPAGETGDAGRGR